MKASEELREKMWELCYDLLPDDERRALVANIKSDPQAARLYAEVRLQADLVGYASKVEDSSLILSPEGRKTSDTDLAPAAARHKDVLQPSLSTPKSAAKLASNNTSWAAWLPAVAALCLLALIGYGTIRPNVGPHQLANAVVTEVEVPGLMQPGLSNRVHLRSKRFDGSPAPAELDVKLVDRRGEVWHHQVVQADELGQATIELPGQTVADGMRLEASARPDGFVRDDYQPTSGVAARLESTNVVSAPLLVAPDKPLTYVIQDKPSPQPGEPTRYAMYSVSRFGMQMQPAAGWELTENQVTEKELAAREFTIKQLRQGLDARQSVTRMKQSLADGVVEGTFFDAEDARVTEALALLQHAKERATGLADQISPGQTSPSEPSPSKPGEGQVPEGLGAGSEADRNFRMQLAREEDETRLAQRFYRATPRRNVQLLDSLALQSGKAQQMKDAEVREKLAELEAAKGGAGGSDPLADRLTTDDRADAKKRLATLPFAEGTEEAKAKEMEEDKASGGANALAPIAAQPHGYHEKADLAKDFAYIEPVIVSAGAPVTIAVPSELAEKKLLLEARCRDVTVATTAMNPAEKSPLSLEGKPGGESQLAKNEADTQARDAFGTTWQFALQLPPEVDGDVQVRLIDTSVSPPQVVAQQWFYRQPAKELKLALVAVNGLTDAKNEFKPGEKVSLRFRVLSEHDQPEAALLPVRVWREDAIEASGQEPVMLADYVRSQSALYEASGYASSSMRGLARMRKGSESLDRALAMQAPRQQADLKKADGAFPKAMSVAPKTVESPIASPPLAAAVPGTSPEATRSTASPEATTANPPAPAEAPALARSDAQIPAPPAPAPAAPEVVPPAPAAETAAAGNLAYGALGMPAAPLPTEATTTPVESAELYAMSPDSFAEWTVALPVEPKVVSNRHDIDRQREIAAQDSAAAWEAWRAIVGRVLVIGGLAALAGLFALFLIRTPVRAGSGTLALVGGVASLLVGAFWIADGRQATQIAGLPAVKSEVVAKSPSARTSDFGNLTESAEASGRGLGGGEVPPSVEQSTTLDDLPAKSPTKDESLLQENAAALAQESAPARPGSAGDRPGLGGLGGFGKEATAAADGRDNLTPADKPGAGGGGFGGGRMSKSGGTGGLESLAPGGADAPTRGSLRTKEPVAADADSGNAEANTDKFGAEKSRPYGATENRGSSGKLDSPRGGQANQPPAPVRAAAVAPPAETVPAPAPAPASAPGLPATTGTVAGEDRKDELGEAKVGRRRSGTDAAPVTLYFNPRLETDADGYATIEFQMPDAEADYRILIDAFGHGRIGSAEMLIMCRK